MELGNLLPLYFGRQEFVAPDLGGFAIYQSLLTCLLGVQEIFANTALRVSGSRIFSNYRYRGNQL